MTDFYTPSYGDPNDPTAMLQFLAPSMIPSQTDLLAKPTKTMTGISQYNAQDTALYHLLQNITSPEAGLLGVAAGMPDAYNFMSTVPDQQPVPQPYISTPTLDSLRKGNYRVVADSIDAGADLPTVNAAIRNLDGVDDNTKKDLTSAAAAAIKEKQDADKANFDYEQKVQTQKQTPTPMAKMLQAAGLPDPAQDYTAADFPQQNDNIDSHNYDNAQEYGQRALQMAKDARATQQQAADNVAPILLMQKLAPALQAAAKAAAADKAHIANVESGNSNLEAAGMGQHALDYLGDMWHKAAGEGPEDITASVAPNLQMGAPARSAPQGNPMEAGARARVSQSGHMMDDAKKKAAQAQAMHRIAVQQVRDVQAKHDWMSQFAANRAKAAGQTPFNNAIAQRQALLDSLRGN